MTRIAVTADRRAVAAFEIQDLAKLQSQLESKDSDIRQSLLFAVNRKINDYLYTLAVPSTVTPDHQISGVTDFNAAQVNDMRKLASQARWAREKGWWLLADPQYMSDLLNAATLTSSDYGASDAPVIGGQMAMKRFGFNILEDNSDGILSLSPATAGADVALAFHPDFMHLVMQTQPTFQLSSLHSQKKFGYLLSVDIVYGAALGINGSKKCIKTYNT
jgi:hypothetical protein